MQNSFGTTLHHCTSFHPQTDGQTERVNQVIEDMLRCYMLDFKGGWEDHIRLIEFAYNSSYHASIGIALFVALYGRPCRTPVCWNEVGDSSIYGSDYIKETTEKIAIITQRLRIAQSRQ